MIDAELLLTDTKKLVVDLIDDLRTVGANEPSAAGYLDDEYQRAHSASRTAFGKAEWAEGLLAQVAVAWVLGGVFVRFCEDNGLIDEPLLGGPGIRSQLALDQRAEYLRANPAHDDRHWLREVFGRLRALPATGEIFGGHNPVWAEGLLPSADGARKLREELARIDPDTGELRHDFTDPEWDTRFLGDLYQDLSDHAKKTYALLQTPVFVEEFILDLTLSPALATYGLADTTIIDPTCGSGHFLLGAFERLFARWVDDCPTAPRRELAQRALDAIGGIDLNPFAASIARFRLLLVALRAGGDSRLVDAPAYEMHIAVGDSLLHGDPPGAIPGIHTEEELSLAANHGYHSEDIREARDLLRRGWSAVVGNPPYIAVTDKALRAAYKSRFKSCHGKWTLGIPFMERFWQLGRQDADGARAGFIGLITDNSFMKRVKGQKLVESWLPLNDLTHVLDTSGVPIPGHGTGSVILFGRNRSPVSSTVRSLLKRADDPRHTHGELSPSWQAVLSQLDSPGSESLYFSCVDLPRERLYKHPWSIGGGGASELKERLDGVGVTTLDSVSESIGVLSVPGTDDALLAPAAAFVRAGVRLHRPVVTGEAVRDFVLGEFPHGLFPYDSDFGVIPFGEIPTPELHWLWPQRTVLASYVMFGQVKAERCLEWYEWGFIIPDRLKVRRSIAFASVATGNHFVLSSEGHAFKQSAPVVQLAENADDDRAIGLLGILNSSTSCFWMKQVAHQKGGDGVGRGIQDEAWETRFDFDSTKLRKFPVPVALPTDVAARLSDLAVEAGQLTPDSVVRRELPTRPGLEAARIESERVRAAMIAAQEQLDWEAYEIYGLLSDDRGVDAEPDPPLQLGERAFEIVLARRVAAGQAETSWFDRHGSSAKVELPDHWPPRYRAKVERRIELIESDSNIGLIERPEYKRRWSSRAWSDQVESALRDWLQTRLESPLYWPEPAAVTTVARLATIARGDEQFVQVSRLFEGRDDLDLARLIGRLVAAESVAYLAALRYTDSGLRKHTEWLRTWDLQRREDTGEEVGLIPVPPRYAKADFRDVAWEHRGKLDVPKERFISYPGAERVTDASMVVGWAGWNHLDRARALAAWYLQARRDGRDTAHLTPLLAGLAELVPWLKQWYDEPNSDPALDRPGTQIAALVDTETRSLGLTPEALTEWRPEKKRGGRRRKASS